MADDLTALREEVAQLRADLKEVRGDLRKALKILGILPLRPGEPWPKYLQLEVESLVLRDPENPRAVPLRIDPTEDGGQITFNDRNFRTRGEIRVNDRGAQLTIWNAEGKAILSLGEVRDGEAHVYVAKADGKPAAGLQVKDGRGMVNVLDEKNRALVLLREADDGGEVIVANRNGRPAVMHKAVDKGGLVTVHEPSGQMMAFLFGTADNGSVTVYGPQGAMAGSLSAMEDGGQMVLFDAEGKSTAHYP